MIAVTNGTDTKLVPVITTAVCVFSIAEGLIPDTVGLVSVTKVIDPPNATAVPLIVICPEPTKDVFAMF